MEFLPFAHIVGVGAAVREATSALPDARVVPSLEPAPRAVRARTSLATGLHRLADAVAPRVSCP